jgi:hypothetical protein
MLKDWHKLKMFLHVQSIQTSRVDNLLFFQTSFFYTKMYAIHYNNRKGFLNLWLERQKDLN